MPDFAHRTIPMVYSLAPDGSSIRCRGTTESGQNTESTNATADYGSIIEFAVFLFSDADWEWKGGGFTCSIAEMTEQTVKSRGPFEWCRVSALNGDPPRQRLPRGFYI